MICFQNDAAGQIFYSLGVAVGSHLLLVSNYRHMSYFSKQNDISTISPT